MATSQIPEMWEKENEDQQGVVCETFYQDLLTRETPALKNITMLVDVWAYLRKYQVLTAATEQRLKAGSIEVDTVEKLLSYISTQPVWSFHGLMRALHLTNQDHVIRRLGLDPKVYEDSAEEQMDLDSLPEERLVPTKAATKASEGRKKRDVLPAEDVDEGLELEPLNCQEHPEELHEELDDAEHGLTRHNERIVGGSLSGEPPHQPRCRKPARFWCLLTAGLSTVIAIVLVVVMIDHSTKTTTPTAIYMDTATNITTPMTSATNITTPMTSATNMTSLMTTGINMTTTPMTTTTKTTTPMTTVTETTTPITTDTETTTPITTDTETTTPITTTTETTTPITTTTKTTTPMTTTTKTTTPMTTTTKTTTPMTTTTKTITPITTTTKTTTPSAGPPTNEDSTPITSTTPTETTLTSGTPPTNATYLLGCQRVNERMGRWIYDLCWTDQDTLIAADYWGDQLVKYSIDRVTRTCTGQVLDSGYRPRSVSCSQGGLVFVTESTSGVVKVRVYNVSTGRREEVWDTNINTQFYSVHVSRSAEYIVLSAYNKIYVYNQTRVLLYSVTHDQAPDGFLQTYVTETGVFWGTVYNWPKNKLLIMDLSTNETKISTEGIVSARGVSGTRNGYVYVTAYNNADVGVYSADGTFLHLLHIAPPPGGGGLYYSGAISLSDTEDLIAFCTYNEAIPIAVYWSHP